ncbi:MAG: ATP-binding protein [Chloroflexota bacterium]
MSLRGRLTLLYTSLVGGILLLFDLLVCLSVNIMLINQLDGVLRRTASDLIENTRVNSVGMLNMILLPKIDLPADVYVQLWGTGGTLNAASPNAGQLKTPLDAVSIDSATPVLRDSYTLGAHWRVFTIPLKLLDGNRHVGTLQVATKMAVVDSTQQILVIILLFGTVISIGITALAAWFSARQTLAPLQDVTQAALQITRADDLSRRIPMRGLPGDEIGTLISTFNQTLGRLESLFNSQRRFMADVGHELRTPLTVIKGNVSLMRRMNAMDEESLCGIENEVDRLTRLVGDLLLLAQAESGKIPLDRRVVEMDTLALEVLNQMRVLARDRLTLRLGEIDQVLVCGDRDRLKQVFVNLLGNAVKYTPMGGEVVVGVGKVGQQARLTVSDNGPGIPLEDQPYLFERFYRGEKARTRSKDGKGFGLGLSIAYWIVRNHGGRIEVDSVEGRGTTFAVWLPLADQDCV